MLSTVRLGSSRYNVKLYTLGAQCASMTLAIPYSRSLLTVPLQSRIHHLPTSRSRSIHVYVPDPEAIKSKTKTIKSNARIVADHYDLNSFLRYQATNAITPTTSVYLGTRYEYLIQRHLQDRLGFSLTRIGGKGDGGVDLIGTWTLPSISSTPSTSTVLPSTTFRILIQAKRLAPHRKPMPALMRELEGTLNSSTSARPISEAFQYHLLRKQEERLRSTMIAPVNQALSADTTPTPTTKTNSTTTNNPTEQPTLAILITTNPLTPGIQSFMASSRRNLMYICLEETSPPNSPNSLSSANSSSNTQTIPSTRIQQITWNAAAAQAGLEGYNVGMRYTSATHNHPSSSSSTTATITGSNTSHPTNEAILMYNGQPINFHTSQQRPDNP